MPSSWGEEVEWAGTGELHACASTTVPFSPTPYFPLLAFSLHAQKTDGQDWDWRGMMEKVLHTPPPSPFSFSSPTLPMCLACSFFFSTYPLLPVPYFTTMPMPTFPTHHRCCTAFLLPIHHACFLHAYHHHSSLSSLPVPMPMPVHHAAFYYARLFHFPPTSRACCLPSYHARHCPTPSLPAFPIPHQLPAFLVVCLPAYTQTTFLPTCFHTPAFPALFTYLFLLALQDSFAGLLLLYHTFLCLLPYHHLLTCPTTFLPFACTFYLGFGFCIHMPPPACFVLACPLLVWRQCFYHAFYC